MIDEGTDNVEATRSSTIVESKSADDADDGSSRAPSASSDNDSAGITGTAATVAVLTLAEIANSDSRSGWRKENPGSTNSVRSNCSGRIGSGYRVNRSRG